MGIVRDATRAVGTADDHATVAATRARAASIASLALLRHGIACSPTTVRVEAGANGQPTILVRLPADGSIDLLHDGARLARAISDDLGPLVRPALVRVTFEHRASAVEPPAGGPGRS